MEARRPPGLVRKQLEKQARKEQNIRRSSSPDRDSPDDDLKEHVQALLDLDVNLRGYGLRADVVKGEAQLYGVVDTLSEKEYAQELAKTVPGIKKVANRISISTDGPITDRDVEFEVAEELEAGPGVDTRQIGAESSGGVVSLVGRAEDPAAIESARQAAAKARGVARVVSKIKPQDRPRPGELHSQGRTGGEQAPDKKEER